jgi:RimJ/RimL family protein N-acetyltransferase
MKRQSNTNPKPRTVSVFLRCLEETDVERTYRWHNDSRLYATLGDQFRLVSMASEKEWLKQKVSYKSTEVNLAICLKPNGEHIGNIYLRDIDWVTRRAVLHIFIGCSEQRGKGYGSAAVDQLLKLAFRELNLNRVNLQVLADNRGAIHLYEKVGFKTEGRLRQHVFKDGQFKDMLVMGIMPDEYISNKK